MGVLESNLELALKSHDAKKKGCGICHFPRSDYQINKRKHRLCTLSGALFKYIPKGVTFPLAGIIARF